MQIINNQCLSQMTSPIKYVFPYIHKIIKLFAPERNIEFDCMYSDFTITYTDGFTFKISVDPLKNVITISRKSVEVIWAATFSYMKIWDINRNSLNGALSQSEAEEKARPYLELLTWAYKTFLEHKDIEWPDHLKRPLKNCLHDADQNAETIAALGAISFVLLHEFSHISLKHSKGTIEEEKEADYAAIDWLLQKCPDDTDKKRRGIACAISLLILVANDIHSNKVPSPSHPNGYDRLINTLEKYFEEENHTVWCFSETMISLHLQNSKIKINWDEVPATSARDMVNYYADAISENIAERHKSGSYTNNNDLFFIK